MKNYTWLEFWIETIKDNVIYWFMRNFQCRFGHHHIIKIFADDEYPNPEGCKYCGIGFTYLDDDNE